MAPTPRYCPDGCGALVLRGRTEALKWQLLNLDPDPAGNVAVRVDAQDNVFARGLRKGEESAAFEAVYMPHKATCQVEARLREQRARQAGASVTQLNAWKTARSVQARAQRNQRGKRWPQPRVTGVRYNPRGRST